MRTSYSLTAIVLAALLLTPMLEVCGAVDPFQSSSRQGMFSGYGSDRRPAQMPNGEDARQTLQKEKHRLSASEKALYAGALRQIQSGEILVKHGLDMQGTRDHRSGLDGKVISAARTRQAGAEKVAEGRRLIRQGENRLVTLASQVVERLEGAENKMKSGEFHTWTDKDGRELSAIFLSLNDESVSVIREDGLEFEIPLATLSEKDISFSVLANQGIGLDSASFLKAIESSKQATITHLLTAGYQPSPSTQKLALERIIREQSSSMLETVLANGIDPNLLLDSGQLPLSHAVELSNLELINTLLKFEASLLKEDAYGLLPSYYALVDPDLKVIELVIPDKAHLPESIHRVFEYVAKGDLESVSIEHLKLLAQHEAGESLAPEQTATVDLILAAQNPVASGFFKALVEEDRHQYLPLYRDAGVAAKAIETGWEKVLSIVKQSPNNALDELLKTEGLTKQKANQLHLLGAGFEPDTTGFSREECEGVKRTGYMLTSLTDIVFLCRNAP